MITSTEITALIIIIVLIIIWRFRRTYITTSPLYFKIKPNNTVFAFDMHGVILSADASKIISYLWYKFPKRAIFQILLRPKLWMPFWNLVQRKIVPPEFFELIKQNYPNLSYIKEYFLEVLNLQNLDNETIKLIYKLKKHGYVVVLASNMSRASLEKIQKTHPVLTTLFDAICIPEAHNGYASKPSKKYFDDLRTCVYSYTKIKKYIILIDNYLPNIKGAYHAGIHGITFNTAQQICKRLFNEQC